MQLRRIEPCIIALFLAARCCIAYTVREAVDTHISAGSVFSQDVLRNQMPLFGIDSEAKFQIEEGAKSFALSFEDGLQGLPAVSVERRGNSLASLEVTFVYSKSGGGAIHSVSSKADYSAGQGRSKEGSDPRFGFTVYYRWIEEAAVYENAGQAVMLFAVFIVSMFFIFSTCGLMDDEDYPPPATKKTRNRSIGIAASPMMMDTPTASKYQ